MDQYSTGRSTEEALNEAFDRVLTEAKLAPATDAVNSLSVEGIEAARGWLAERMEATAVKLAMSLGASLEQARVWAERLFEAVDAKAVVMFAGGAS